MRPWEHFFKDKITQLFNQGGVIIDVGGGLRVIKEKGNRYDSSREWIRPLIKKTDYKILDIVNTYHPDIVGDIQHLSFENNSVDAVICIAVLQHVERPHDALNEIYRVLKPGGHVFLYVPFLYYYHGQSGYYKDYWRFTEDSLRLISKQFAKFEIVHVRGAIETWIKLSPLGRWGFMNNLAYLFDKISGKIKTKQVSGYNIFLTK